MKLHHRDKGSGRVGLKPGVIRTVWELLGENNAWTVKSILALDEKSINLAIPNSTIFKKVGPWDKPLNPFRAQFPHL